MNNRLLVMNKMSKWYTGPLLSNKSHKLSYSFMDIHGLLEVRGETRCPGEYVGVQCLASHTTLLRQTHSSSTYNVFLQLKK